MAPELDPESGAVIITPEGETPVDQGQEGGPQNDLPGSALEEQPQEPQQ
jgi:hypothetical protein